MSSLGSLVLEKAYELGFDRAGITPVGPPTHRDAFERWLDLGYHGSMSYLERHREIRLDPTRLHPGAVSVVAVAKSYRPIDERGGERAIARYARGLDYHRVMGDRLRRLAAFLEREVGPMVQRSRVCVDTAPILERDFAVQAGLGWLGKNTNLVCPELGSYLFLGELLVCRELGGGEEPVPDRCGRCRACLDRCPTKALVAPWVMDSRRCLSYLTIEHKGAIPVELRSALGLRLFGCDVCQSVCPWNRRARPSGEPFFAGGEELEGLDAADVLWLSEAEFRQRFRLSPLWRAGREGLARNAAVVLGNAGDPRAIDPLVQVLENHDSPLVRGHAAWALGRFGDCRARAALDRALVREDHLAVLGEIRQALSTG
ncbi:MAG: tRNA epoxyqueuosine(34) reductase QueG [Bradymonadales bacterium]|nr:tRNA epoxyqueuosine(34) reductase QueG [Bradymonadales bacterium]